MKTPPLLIGPAVGKENTLADAFAQNDALYYVAIRRYLASFARGNKENRTTKCLREKERKNFNQAVFALGFFCRRQDVGDNGCAFLNGGLLTGDIYTQTATASGSCSYVSKLTANPNGRYKIITTTIDTTNTYTYTYNITANAPYDTDPVPALAAWDHVGSTGGGDTAHVDINGQIAGESVISKTALPRKYSFSLGEDPLNPTISRVQNLAIGSAAAALRFPLPALIR